MKKYLMLLLALLMVVSLCACGQNEDKSSSKTNPGTSANKTDSASQKKQEGNVNIKITPPEGWTKNEGSVLPVHYMNGTASFMVKEEHFTSTTLDEVVTEALGIYQKSFENLKKQGDVEPLTVDGKDARKLTFTCTVSKMNMKYTYVYLFASDRTYVITFGDLESTFDSLSDDYETILSNIRFEAQ